MIRILLYILEKIPYRTEFGLSLSDILKIWYYWKIGQFKQPEKCLCGGTVTTWTHPCGQDEVGWETSCNLCKLIYDED